METIKNTIAMIYEFMYYELWAYRRKWCMNTKIILELWCVCFTEKTGNVSWIFYEAEKFSHSEIKWHENFAELFGELFMKLNTK